jgi:hypothetical protein
MAVPANIQLVFGVLHKPSASQRMALPSRILQPTRQGRLQGVLCSAATSAPPASIFFDVTFPRAGMDVDLREDESVSVEPVRVLGVECHEFVE